MGRSGLGTSDPWPHCEEQDTAPTVPRPRQSRSWDILPLLARGSHAGPSRREHVPETAVCVRLSVHP